MNKSQPTQDVNAIPITPSMLPIFIPFDPHSKNVKRLVCKTFMARFASNASTTHEMLISLAPSWQVSFHCRSISVNVTYLAKSSQYSHCSPPTSRTSSPQCQSYASSQHPPDSG